MTNYPDEIFDECEHTPPCLLADGDETPCGQSVIDEPAMTDRCEAPDASLHACRARGTWRVAVGTRQSDAQLACGRHLNSVCLAMRAAELPRHAFLTVTAADEQP